MNGWAGFFFQAFTYNLLKFKPQFIALIEEENKKGV